MQRIKRFSALYLSVVALTLSFMALFLSFRTPEKALGAFRSVGLAAITEAAPVTYPTNEIGWAWPVGTTTYPTGGGLNIEGAETLTLYFLVQASTTDERLAWTYEFSDDDVDNGDSEHWFPADSKSTTGTGVTHNGSPEYHYLQLATTATTSRAIVIGDLDSKFFRIKIRNTRVNEDVAPSSATTSEVRLWIGGALNSK